MSMNRYMHLRNIYKNKPDFLQLAGTDSEFKKYLKIGLSGKPSIDFSNKDAVRALTHALLVKDFDLQVDIPSDTLIPTLPLRLNYLLWIEDLLHWSKNDQRSIRGIDIGAGASCIYPLLAAKTNGWKMTGTEIQEESVKVARTNIERNNLQHLITVVKAEELKILVGVLHEGETFDFCMCNPPFFSTESETDSLAKARSPHREPPKNAFSGTKSELVVRGGELEFIRRIIAESQQLNTRVRIYTSMVGHKNNANTLLSELQTSGAKWVSRTEFCQGNTTRWGIAWTFCAEAKLPPPQQQVAHNKKLHQPLELVIPEDVEGVEYTVFCLTNRMLEIFKDLKFEVKETGKPFVESSKKACFNIQAVEDTWSNQRRRRREQRSAQLSNLDQMEPQAKKQKLDPEEPRPDLLFFKTIVCQVQEKIVMKFTWTNGSLGKDSLHQIVQFLKNSLKINNKKS